LQSENTAYAYNDANELTTSSYGSPVHDKNGNLTVQPGFGGATALTYDVNNRVTSITGPAVAATTKYYGDGKLAELDSSSSSRRFLMDPTVSGNRILAELDATGGWQIGYAYGPLGMVSQSSGGQTSFYFHNLQGSTVVITDASGAQQASYRYDPFGHTIQSVGSTSSFTFMGRYAVPTVANYSLTSFRVYDAISGRFTSEDPAFYSTDVSISPFVYAAQSPLKFVDPSGLSWYNPATWGWVNSIADKVGDFSDSATFSSINQQLPSIDSPTFSFADNQLLVDTVKGIPSAAVTVGACAVGVQQACDIISNSGFSKSEVAAIQAEGTIITAYFGGAEAAKIIQGVSWTSKGVQGLTEVVPKMMNGTLTVPEALNVLKDYGLDLAADQLDEIVGLVGHSLGDLGLGGLITSGIDQKLLTPPSSSSTVLKNGNGGHK
jgi:RHS repeat-associated protein